MRKLWLLLMTVLFLFSACTQDSGRVPAKVPVSSGQITSGTMEEYESTEYEYDMTVLPIPKLCKPQKIGPGLLISIPGQYIRYYNGYIFVYVSDNTAGESENVTSYVQYDTDGNYIKKYTFVTSDLRALYYKTFDFCVDTTETVWARVIVENDQKNNAKVYLQSFDDENVLLNRVELPEYQFVNSYVAPIDADVSFYTYCPQGRAPMIRILDSSLRLSPALSADVPVVAGFRHDDGRIIFVCENHECLWYNEEAQTLVPVTLYRDTEARRRADTVLYAENSDVYFIDDRGITVQRGDTELLLCDFEKSGYAREQMEFVDVLPDGKFLVWYTDTLLGEDCPAIFAPTEEEWRPARKVIRVASIGSDAYLYPEMIRAELLDLTVSYFNRTNDEYRIVFDDFDEMAHYSENGNFIPGNTTQQRDALFEEALLYGEPYDVYLIGSGYSGLEKLMDKGIFADLSDFAQRRKLLECVQDSMRRSGEITAIPFSAELSTLVTTTDILPEGTPFTYDKLFEIFDGLDADESLFATYTQREMYDIALYDYVDFENRTCSFDTPEFVRVLQFLTDYENAIFSGGTDLSTAKPSAYWNSTYGDYEIGNSIMYGDIFTPFAEGKIKFLEFRITTPKSVPMLYYLFDQIDADYTVCGYPSVNGGSMHMTAGMYMSVGRDTEVWSGALEYLTFLLSDTIQASETLQAFPVTRSAAEKTLGSGYHYYSVSTEQDAGRPEETYLNLYFGEFSEKALTQNDSYFYNTVIEVSASARDALLSYLCDSSMRGAGDTVIRSIIEEELSYAAQGVRTVEEAAKIIQSRVFIYINE